MQLCITPTEIYPPTVRQQNTGGRRCSYHRRPLGGSNSILRFSYKPKEEEKPHIGWERQQESCVWRVLVENNDIEHFRFQNAEEKAILQQKEEEAASSQTRQKERYLHRRV